MATAARHAVLPDEATARATMEWALAQGDVLAAEATARLLMAGGRSPDALYDDVLRPLLESVGDRWATGELRVEQEHTFSATVSVLLHRLAAPAGEGRRGLIVLSGAPGEQHLLGALMLRDSLVRAGWSVSFPGELPAEELAAHCLRLGDEVRVVGLTLHSAQRLRTLRAAITLLRSALPRVPVILGGQAVRHDPDLPVKAGADAGAGDLGRALRGVEELTTPLTLRERQVLQLVSDGLSNAEVAQCLGTAPSTVKTHLERIYLKVGTGDRAAAVAQALRYGWIR